MKKCGFCIHQKGQHFDAFEIFAPPACQFSFEYANQIESRDIVNIRRRKRQKYSSSREKVVGISASEGEVWESGLMNGEVMERSCCVDGCLISNSVVIGRRGDVVKWNLIFGKEK